MHRENLIKPGYLVIDKDSMQYRGDGYHRSEYSLGFPASYMTTITTINLDEDLVKLLDDIIEDRGLKKRKFPRVTTVSLLIKEAWDKLPKNRGDHE